MDVYCDSGLSDIRLWDAAFPMVSSYLQPEMHRQGSGPGFSKPRKQEAEEDGDFFSSKNETSCIEKVQKHMIF